MTNFIEYRTQIRGLSRAFPAQAQSHAEMTCLRFFKYIRKQVHDVLKDEWMASRFLRMLTIASRHMKKCLSESTNDALVQACKISLQFDISLLPVSYFFQETLTTSGAILGVRSCCHIDSKGFELELSAVSKTQRDQYMIDSFCEKIGVKNVVYKNEMPVNTVVLFNDLLQKVKKKSLLYSQAVNARIADYHKSLIERLNAAGLDKVDLLLIKSETSY